MWARVVLTALAAAAALLPVAPARAPAQAVSDPVGAPGRYTILRGDDLFISRRGGDGTASVGWLQATNALAVAAQSPFAAAGVAPRETLFPQARGRFRDHLTDRVLAFRQLQSSAGVRFELAEPNPLAEPGWSAGEPGGSLPTVNFPVPNPEAAAPSALATGDLDGLADAAGNLHDEAVIAFKDADDGLEVRVVDYNATPGRATLTAPQGLLPGVGGPAAPGSIAAGIGDFDADGVNEIAIAWQRVKTSGGAQNTELHLTILRYTRSPAPKVVTLAPQVNLPAGVAVTGTDRWPSYELAVADLDGEPGDELAVSQIGSNRDVKGASITMIGLNSAWGVAHVGQGVVQGLMNPPETNPEWRPRLVAGLFHLDPAKGFSLRRRQLALEWLAFGVFPVMQVFDVVVTPYECAQDGGVVSPCDLELIALTPQVTVEPALGTATMGFAAGGFAGTPATGEPTPWGLATASSAARTVKLWKLTPQSGAPQPFTLSETTRVPIGDPGVPFSSSPASLGANLTAYDRQGRSLVLGAPLVSTLEAQPSPAVIFQDAPKHVDWLDKGWVNVSRTPEINVTFTDETNKAFAHNTTTTSDFTIGGSASNTVTATAEEGLPGIEETEDSLQVTAGMKYSYDLDEAKYKKSAQNYSLTIKASTGDDDLVGGAYETISIWRYPILGQLLMRRDGTVVTDASGRSLHPYYELQIPGPVEKLSPPVAGRGLDWYQPLHENGNALSYPQRTPATLGGLVPIADRDVGAYQLPGDPAPKRQILANLGYALDPTTSSVDLDISATTGGGQDRKTENTVGWNLGIKNSVFAQIGGPVLAGGSLQDDINLEVASDSSWGKITTAEHSTTSAKGFAVERGVPEQGGGVTQSQAYNVATAYYYSPTGIQKVEHAVDLAENLSGTEWWTETAYSRPDPALNLPFRIDMTRNTSGTGVFDAPAWSNSLGHQRLRQFFTVHPPDPGRPLVSGAPLNVAPVTGQKVEFHVRVYNYSLGSATGDFDAKFVALPVDARTGEPEDVQVEIDTVPVRSLVPRESRVVSAAWTAKGPVDRDTSQLWRIFVILDPDDRVKGETHELDDRYNQPPTRDKKRIIDPLTGKDEALESGQNNQGFGLLTVHSPVGASARALTAQASRRRAARRGPDIRLRRAAIAVGRPHARLRRRGARARVGRPLMVRVRVEARRRHRRHHHVLLYDKPRGARARVIGAEPVHGVSHRRGTYVWFTWQPRRPGRHRLVARVLEPSNDGRRGNARARLDVRVQPHVVRRPRLRELAGRVVERDFPRRSERRLIRLARSAQSALRDGRVRIARRRLRRFSAAALVGLGVTVARRDAADLRYHSRSIRSDLRIERLPPRIRALATAPGVRRALREHAQRARAALRRGRPAAARRELLALARAARRVRGARRVGALARGLAVQLR